MNFSLDFRALALVALLSVPFFFLWRTKKKFAEPFLAFCDVSSIKTENRRLRLSQWPLKLFYLTLILFALAFLDPTIFLPKTRTEGQNNPLIPPTEGVAIYIVLDQSGSMKDIVLAKTSSGQRLLSKIDLVKEVTKEFILGDPQLGLYGRPNDLIGLIFFARAARVQAPLTLDHEAVLQALSKFNTIGIPEQDGTSIGYAIYKAADLMAATNHYAKELISKGKPAYAIKNNLIILLTDGLQDPNPLDKGKRLRNLDVPEAAAYAKEKGIKLYMVNVDPSMATEEFAPYRHIMQRAAEVTGGKFYMVDSAAELSQIYHDIDQLEKSSIPGDQSLQKDKRPDLYHRISFAPYLIAAGLLSLFIALLLETRILRRVP